MAREGRDESCWPTDHGKVGSVQVVEDPKAFDPASGHEATDHAPSGDEDQMAYDPASDHAERDREEHEGRMVSGHLVYDHQDHRVHILADSLDFVGVVNEDLVVPATWNRLKYLAENWLGYW